jgi:hypothetical protein
MHFPPFVSLQQTPLVHAVGPPQEILHLPTIEPPYGVHVGLALHAPGAHSIRAWGDAPQFILASSTHAPSAHVIVQVSASAEIEPEQLSAPAQSNVHVPASHPLFLQAFFALHAKVQPLPLHDAVSQEWSFPLHSNEHLSEEQNAAPHAPVPQ